MTPGGLRARIAVVGAGAWGTALALHLARREGSSTVLWARDPAQAAAMASERVNARYLPGVALPPALAVTAGLDDLADAEARGADQLVLGMRIGVLVILGAVLEVGAVLYDFARQPRASREFFIKYQDRVLFGKDAYYPEEYPYYWRVFETTDEYFDYYRDYHAFWKLYGMDLPDEVLKKLYYKNALRVAPGLPQAGWPR